MKNLRELAALLDRTVRALPGGMLRFWAAVTIVQMTLIGYLWLSASAMWCLSKILLPGPFAGVVLLSLFFGFLGATSVLIARGFSWIVSVTSGARPNHEATASLLCDHGSRSVQIRRDPCADERH